MTSPNSDQSWAKAWAAGERGAYSATGAWRSAMRSTSLA